MNSFVITSDVLASLARQLSSRSRGYGARRGPSKHAAAEDGAPVSILAVVGLQFEARIVASATVRTVVFGTAPLAAALLPTDCGVLSFGICGGLAPGLRPGTCVIASSVCHGSRVWTADAA